MQKTILSTADVARLFNVTETTVKRWADGGALQCQKTPGGHRKFVIRYVIEFAEKNKLEPSGVLEMPEEEGATDIEVAVLQKDFAALVRTFAEKALSTNRQELFLLLSYLYEHHFQLWEISDQIVRPGMAIVGELWTHGTVSISKEHMASYQLVDALAKLQMQIRVKPAHGLSAVCAAPADELHSIGLRSAAYALESEGWKAHFLGARTPLGELESWIRDEHPALVCLSITTDGVKRSLQREIRSVAAVAHKHGAKLVLGGLATTAQGFRGRHADAVVDGIRSLLDYATTLEPARGDTAGAS